MRLLVKILARLHFFFIHRYVINKSTGKCEISKSARLKGVILSGSGSIRIGNNSTVEHDTILSGNIHIKSDCLVQKASLHGNIELNENVKIKGPVSFMSGSGITIGRFSSVVGPNTDIIASINPVTIGNFCSIARNVSIQEHNHMFESTSTYFIHSNLFNEENKNIYSKGPVEIGNDVWIGTQSVILSGSKIGNGAVVAANSVVTGKVPPFAIVAGSPAKVIKYRFEKEIIDHLEQIAWWNWDIEKIRRNKTLFDGKLTLDKLNNIHE